MSGFGSLLVFVWPSAPFLRARKHLSPRQMRGHSRMTTSLFMLWVVIGWGTVHSRMTMIIFVLLTGDRLRDSE